MQKNLSIPKVQSMYTSLAREAHEFWNMDIDPVPFSIKPYYATLFGGDTADPDAVWALRNRPSASMAVTEFVANIFPVAIDFNEFWLPYLYEDEVICCILHELAHVYTGWETDNGGHGPAWAQAAYEIGSVGVAAFSTRSSFAGELPWFTEDDVRAVRERYPEPTLGWF